MSGVEVMAGAAGVVHALKVWAAMMGALVAGARPGGEQGVLDVVNRSIGEIIDGLVSLVPVEQRIGFDDAMLDALSELVPGLGALVHQAETPEPVFAEPVDLVDGGDFEPEPADTSPLDELWAYVGALRGELVALREELAVEVRTTRLVVVHPDDGRELIYTDRLSESIGLRVQWQPGEESVILSAGEECDGEAGVAVLGAGQVLGMLNAGRQDRDGGGVLHEARMHLGQAVEDGGQRQVLPYVDMSAEDGMTVRLSHGKVLSSAMMDLAEVVR